MVSRNSTMLILTVIQQLPYFTSSHRFTNFPKTIRTPDGELSLIDLISRSYLQTINPNVVLMSGSQYMPMPGFEANFLVKLLSSTESCLYPIALSLLLSVFMYTLVLEKEERLREMMKMNGLKMRNYWIANYIWNLVLYFPSAAVFLLFGIFVVQMPFFTDTNIFILILLLIGWGLCQASLSFFFQNFFSKARMVTGKKKKFLKSNVC